MDLKKSNPRILFLHGLEGAPGSEKHKLLENKFGSARVMAPNLKTKQTIRILTAVGTFLFIFLAAAAIACFIKVSTRTGLIVLLSTVLGGLIIYWIVGRGATHFMLKRSMAIAEEAFLQFRPNIIVASSFGAVTALSMDTPKCPMVLLAPAQDQYANYMKIDNKLSIKGFPYVLIVHGCNDKTIPVEHSTRLVETSELGKCRLELIEDGHALKSITEEDLQAWVEEAFDKGRQEAMNMAIEGDKHVDMMLFFGSEDEGDKPNSMTERLLPPS